MLVIQPVAPTRKVFEVDLEGLRGFAAILVVWCHAVGMPHYLDPGYMPTGIGAYIPPAHFCVLIFFVLSGYVIGLSTKNDLTLATTGVYLKKRLQRIYPIYFISMLAAMAVGAYVYSGRIVLANFVFLQILTTPIFEQNGAAWSLQYEMVYYLLFIPLSLARVDSLLASVASLVLGLVTLHFLPSAPLLSSYAFGFTFWCCGLVLARYTTLWPRVKTSYTLLVGILLLFFTFSKLNVLEKLLSDASMRVLGHDLAFAPGNNSYEVMLNPHDFAYLPYAILGILVFIHRDFPLRKVILFVAFVLPGLTFLYKTPSQYIATDTAMVLPIVVYCLAVLFFLLRLPFLERISTVIIRKLSKLGSISYGLYIIHMPILFMFKQTAVFSGSALTYWVRFPLFILLAFLAAYLLEKKFHPWVKQRLFV